MKLSRLMRYELMVGSYTAAYRHIQHNQIGYRQTFQHCGHRTIWVFPIGFSLKGHTMPTRCISLSSTTANIGVHFTLQTSGSLRQAFLHYGKRLTLMVENLNIRNGFNLPAGTMPIIQVT